MEDMPLKESRSQSFQSEGSGINGISSDVEQIRISAPQEENEEVKVTDAPVKENAENDQKMEDVAPSAPETNENEQVQDEQPDDDDPEAPLPDFDWADFEARYATAMKEANGKQDKLLEEFESLVRYFGVWAKASADYDDDRSMKRLKTRESYVQRAEGSLEQRKQHYTQVVAAFQSALALLQGV